MRPRPVFEDLLPYVQALMFAMCLLFVFWRGRSSQQRIGDLNVWAACLTLRYWDKSLWALILAIGYTAFTCIPGSFPSGNLPSHATFMRGLKLVEAKDDGEECRICLDDEQRLAKLPCGHRFCIGCLELMGKTLQTACPYCRRPLFGRYDRLVYIATKGATTILVINPILLSLQGIDDARKHHYINASTSLASLCMSGYWLTQVGYLCLQTGEFWWRGLPDVGLDKTAVLSGCCACVSGVTAMWQLLWAIK